METLSKTFSETSHFSIIFFHGFPFDHRMWKHQMKLEGVNLAAIDLLGAGSKRNARIFTLEAMVEEAFSEIYSLGWKNLILCGLSMGGYVALRMLEKYSNSFKGVIFFDTRSEADTNEAKIKRAQAIKNLTESGLEGFLNAFLPGVLAPGSFEKSLDLNADLRNIAGEQNPEGLASQLLAMQGRTDTTHILKEINIPSLVLCGAQDGITPPPGMKSFSEQIPNSEFHLVPNAGHMTPWEQPEITNQIIQKFISQKMKV
jgi:3-oxoadipate enol-lactonase